MSLALAQSYAAAERTTAHWAKSFHFASRFLPTPKKQAIFALYDYCRHADNLVDARGDRPVELVRKDLTELGALVRRVHAGERPADPRWLALHDTLQRYPVPIAPMLALLDGVAMDLEPVSMPDFAALEHYCMLVAGGVGLMLGPVLGAPPERMAESGVKMGIAMQLTNVLRDVGEDLANGRCYLPADELAAFGLSRAMLEERQLTPLVLRFLQWQIARARQYFDEGSRVIPLFEADGSRLTVRLLMETYAGILASIERNGYDVFRTRAYVSGARKLLILGRAMLTERPWIALVPLARSA